MSNPIKQEVTAEATLQIPNLGSHLMKNSMVCFVFALERIFVAAELASEFFFCFSFCAVRFFFCIGLCLRIYSRLLTQTVTVVTQYSFQFWE